MAVLLVELLVGSAGWSQPGWSQLVEPALLLLVGFGLGRALGLGGCLGSAGFCTGRALILGGCLGSGGLVLRRATDPLG